MSEDFYYRGHDREGGLARLEKAGLLSIDMESVSLNDLTAIGIGCYISPDEGFYFPIFPNPSPYLPLILGKVSNPDVTKIYHNGIGFDLEVLTRLGEDEGYDRPDDRGIEDTSIMAQVHGLPAALERLGREWLGADDLFSIKSLFESFACKDMLGVPEERVAEKCLNDCRTTFRLYEYLKPRLSAEQRDCYSVDRKLIHVLRTIQSKCLGLRQGVLEEYHDKLTADIIRIERDCEAEGFHPGSNIQVGFVLAGRGNVLPFTKGARRQLATGEEVLEDIDDPLAAVVLDYRGKVKLLSSYIRPWLGKDRAYTRFRLDLATGRLASGRINAWDDVNRNLQNVPPDVRKIFRPDNRVWTWADWSQQELRILAFMAKDPDMMAEYAKPKPDLHSMLANAAGITRDQGKTFNFARVYGAGDRQLSRKTKVPMKEVPRVRAILSNLFPVSQQWINYTMNNHREYSETLFGRRCRLPEPQPDVQVHPKAFEAHVAKCAVNYAIQGTGADMAKRAMVRLFEEGADLRLQVHDELLVDGEWEPEEWLANIHPELKTPFEVKQGVIWS